MKFGIQCIHKYFHCFEPIQCSNEQILTTCAVNSEIRVESKFNLLFMIDFSIFYENQEGMCLRHESCSLPAWYIPIKDMMTIFRCNFFTIVRACMNRRLVQSQHEIMKWIRCKYQLPEHYIEIAITVSRCLYLII